MKNGTKNGLQHAKKNGAKQNGAKQIDAQKLMERPCSECGGQIKRKAITQEFEREGVKVKISGFMAWTCSRCGEIYFEPEAADRFAQAVSSLFALALAGKQHKGKVIAQVS
ncbi:MAG: YgiT-type zinc finger protein [Blastocatellia bacterium]